MKGILVSKGFVAQFGAELQAAVKAAGVAPEIIHLPDDPAQRLPADVIAKIEVAYLTRDIRFSNLYESYGDTAKAATNLRWANFVSTGIDQHPFLPALHERKVRLTTSAGSNGEPVGHTAVCGLLMLARNFPRWLTAQRERRWDPARMPHFPRDLPGQTALIVGLGSIGSEIARLARALGLKVIGVRRSPQRPGDPVDELHPPQKLAELLPRADWLIIASPLTAETRGMINADLLARLPQGARIINIGRGEIIDETAMIEALRSGHLGGAYLDVFEKEPLPTESPLWDLPNVLISPHNSAAASGNDERVYQMFLANLEHWQHKQALTNEVRGTTT